MIAKLVSRHFDIPGTHTLKVAKENGIYDNLEKIDYTPQQMVDIIKESGLRGKGGGGAPTGAKWQLLLDAMGDEKFVIVNADESEPGTFKDREILSKDPHLLIEGIILTCRATKARSAYIYIRGEYVEFAQIMQQAIDEAYGANILGKESTFGIELTLHRGAGAYICGEKSALIESLEGNRGHPRLKPHTPQSEHFFGMPALVNNVETIASVPYIIYNGAKAYRQYGTKKSPGTLLFALSGHINNPGVYEAPFGINMLEFITAIGGGIKGGKKLKAVIPGGASAPVLTAKEVELARLDYESLRAMGSALGTGGMIVMDESVDMVKALKNLMRFYHHESCGQCTPCREGCGWIDKILDKFLAKEATLEDLETLKRVSSTMNGKTICVFAPAASSVIDAFISKFKAEFLACIKDHHG